MLHFPSSSWIRVPLSDIVNIFSHSVGYHFTLDSILWSRNFFSFSWSPIYFSFCYAFSVISKKPLPNSTSLRFTPLFCSKSFTVLLLKYRSRYDPFWVNFCAWCKAGVQFHSCARGYPDFPVPYVEKTILLHSCWKSIDYKCML